ncbi:nucleotide pyrophosphohydrolase [Modestobacter sp. SYSU DS0290]
MTADPDFDVLRDRLRDFAEARQWGGFHRPKNLAMALGGEVGELLAELQWLSEAEAADLSRAGARRDRVVDEVADVAIYLIRFCDVLDIDLAAAISRRIDQNEQRLPAERVRGRAVRTREVLDELSGAGGDPPPS